MRALRRVGRQQESDDGAGMGEVAARHKRNLVGAGAGALKALWGAGARALEGRGRGSKGRGRVCQGLKSEL